MTNRDLAKTYIWKAKTRLDALEALRKRRNFSDVVREAQETVELALRGMLRGKEWNRRSITTRQPSSGTWRQI